MNRPSRYYKLKFIAGEFAGRIFALDNFVIIGRARDAHIRPGSSDILPEHISLALEEDGSVMMHIYPGAVTAVNNFELAGDTDLSLPVNSDVRLGKDLIFVLEESESALIPDLPEGVGADEEESPTEDITDGNTDEKQSTENTDEKIAEDPSEPAVPVPEGNVTRYASEAELETLKKLNRNIRLKRKVLLLSGVILSLAIVAGSYLYSEMQTESSLTWPGIVENKVDDSEFYVDMGNNAQCMIYYPNMPLMKVNKQKDFCEVMTALGRKRDVPFHLVFSVTELKNGFFIPSEQSFHTWRREISEKDSFSFQGEKERIFFRPQEHGFPAYKQEYIRTFGKLRWQGIATYLRWQNKELVLLREVPLVHYQRAREVLDSFGCFIVSASWSNRHWEIPEKFFPGDPAELLLRVHRELSKNIEFISWNDLSLMLRTLLSRAAAEKDSRMFDTVLPLWLDFREKQEIWYTQHCLAYITYRNAEDQEGMRRILNSCLRHFNTPDDYRHTRILKNIWEIKND